MDRTQKATFSTDNLGGISGGYPLVGATLHKSKKDNLVEDTHNWLRGHIDEICMFEQALPLSLIKSYSLKSPGGDEAGLKTYMNFSRQVRDSSNVLVLSPYAYSQVLYKDKNGNIRYQLDSLTQQPTSIPVRDYLFDVPEKQVLAHIDQNDAAPVNPPAPVISFAYDVLEFSKDGMAAIFLFRTFGDMEGAFIERTIVKILNECHFVRMSCFEVDIF